MAFLGIITGGDPWGTLPLTERETSSFHHYRLPKPPRGRCRIGPKALENHANLERAASSPCAGPAFFRRCRPVAPPIKASTNDATATFSSRGPMFAS